MSIEHQKRGYNTFVGQLITEDVSE